MASKHLQTRLDRSGALSLHLLLSVCHLPISAGRRTEEDIRSYRGILQYIQRFDTAVVRLGFLCQHRNDQMVESIHGDTMA